MYDETDRSHILIMNTNAMNGTITHSKPRRGEITRQKIVRLAAPLFNQHGYAGTSMSELMAVTGLEKGGLYRHFKSKESLAAAAFDYAWETVSAPRQRGIDERDCTLDKLLLLVRNFVEETPRKLPGGCPLLNTAVDSDDGSAVLRHKACTALAEWREEIADLVRAGQDDGDLRPEIEPDSVAVVMISALEGGIMMCRLEKSREPLRTVGTHLEKYLQSLRVKKL